MITMKNAIAPSLLKNCAKRSAITCNCIRHIVLIRSASMCKRAFSTLHNNKTSLGTYDLVVVGGGIVGCATARELKLRHPNLKMAIVEKESDVAFHQSRLNSGVIHAGIYYKPGSLKAKLCVKGLRLMYDYCEKKGIPTLRCGKLIVATNEKEVEWLQTLYDYGMANGVPEMEMVDEIKMREIEPYCKGLQGIWSPHTGSVDYALVTKNLAKDFVEMGGQTSFNFEVSGFDENYCPGTSEKYPILIKSSKNATIETAYVLTSAGLFADKLAVMTGCSVEPRIIPFRGEYFLLNENRKYLVKRHIYPVPDPRFPFLGVHFTPRVDGNIWVGPNAVLALKREGYRWLDIDLPDLKDLIKYPGFRRLIFKYWLPGVKELSKAFVPKLMESDLRKYIPHVDFKDLTRGSTGVQAQAVDAKGEFVDEFVFTTGQTEFSKRILHSRSAPSPAATSSLAIGEAIAEKVEQEFKL